MGFMDLMFGTQDEAQKLNQANVERSLSFLGDVDLSGPFGMSRQALMQGRDDVRQGFGQAIAGVGAAGTGAQLDIESAGKESLGMARQSLAQRGLYGSNLIGNTQAGIGNQTARAQAGVAGQTAAAQGGLAAQRGQMLSQIQSLLAGTWESQAGMQLNRAQSQAETLGKVQHVGQSGLIGSIISGAAGFLGGFYNPGGAGGGQQ